MARNQIGRKKVEVSKRLVDGDDGFHSRMRVGFCCAAPVWKGCTARCRQEEQPYQKLSIAWTAHEALSLSFPAYIVLLGPPPGQQDRQRHQYRRDTVGERDNYDLPHVCLSTKAICRLHGAR